ncbi:hypothetical protein [Nocardia wallacei]|uniref:hypothetical protein n=1 Tax=Nocardia wallacei TaxID=480035 RepID=UPI002458023C|nr:hypothetical protein [Nocardia wallacei]
MASRAYGYVRSLPGGADRAHVEDEIRSVAVGFGCDVERVFVEPAPAVDVLWSLVMEVDRFSGGQVMPALTDLAARRGIDVPRLLTWARRTAPAVAWRALLTALGTAGGELIIVPGPEHLDGLAESRSALLQHLSRVQPGVRVVTLTDLPQQPTQPPSFAPVSAPESSVLVGEFRVKAFAAAVEVASLKSWWHLSQAGLHHRGSDVEAVLRELIGARITTDPPDELDDIRVRLQRTAHTLVIDVHESQNHADEPIPARVRHRCTRATRLESVTGGTVTWCELPLADPGLAALADTIHRYQQLAGPPSSQRSAAGGDRR